MPYYDAPYLLDSVAFAMGIESLVPDIEMHTDSDGKVTPVLVGFIGSGQADPTERPRIQVFPSNKKLPSVAVSPTLLRQRREALGLTIQEMGARLKMTPRFALLAIGNWERFGRVFGEYWPAVSRLLNVSETQTTSTAGPVGV